VTRRSAARKPRRVLVSVVLVLGAACGQGSSTSPASSNPPAASEAAPESTAEPAATSALTDRVWLRADPGAARGAIQVFLSDGTLITDSCFETYRLSQWRRGQDRALTWNEDGIEIHATVVSLDDDELLLRLEPPADAQQQRFRAATAPYVCPDMPR